MAAVVGTAAEWLRAPSPVGAALVIVACAAVAALAWPLKSWRRGVTVAVLVVLAGSVGVVQRRLTLIERDWPAQLGQRIDAAAARLGGDLHAAFHLAERLAAAGATAASSDAASAFRSLAAAVPSTGVESGVVVLDPGGAPWAWAGRQRLEPLVTGDSLAARSTGYYLVLETRRHSTNGRVAVASVLIWAHAAVADRSRSLAEVYRRRTEVGLEVYAAGAAPDSADVFDYSEPTTGGDRILFSTRPLPPRQAEAREAAFSRGARVVAWALLALLLLAFVIGSSASIRLALLPVGVWLALRAPFGSALGIRTPFSAATYFLQSLGPLSSSAAAVALSGAVGAVLALALWRRPARWSGAASAVAVLLIAAVPLLVEMLARGITPPVGGVSFGLWLSWQLALMLPAATLALAAVAVSGARRPSSSRWWPSALASLAAIACATAALSLWQPALGLPRWYPLLWLGPLLLTLLPAPRWATLGAVAIVTGTLAAVLTWTSETNGRLEIASRDVSRLGEEPDPFAIPLLEGFDLDSGSAPSPSEQAGMYALWRRSSLWSERYPARLALWNAAGAPLAELPLDRLSVPDSVVATLVRALPAGTARSVERVPGVPGVHYLMVARLDSARVLSVLIGPRSSLVEPSRLGRLLHPVSRSSMLYRLALAPPAIEPPAIEGRWRWRREAWTARAERNLRLPGGDRQVRAVVDLRGPVPLLVRGALVTALDIAVLTLLWIVAELAAAGLARRPRLRRQLRAFRIQLAAALAGFFILPTVAFAAWTYTHFRDEATSGRDLLIAQSLRDPALSATALQTGGGMANESVLRMLSERINADLALYRGGAFVSTSAPILRDLGVVGPLMDPAAYRALALGGELEMTREGTIPSLAERVGYRVVQPGPPEELGILVTPQVAEFEGLNQPLKQVDLALVLLLATLAGMGAAVGGAGVAARALSRPVADLRRSALALGQGLAPPGDIAAPPLEFEPVFGAFTRMADDINRSRAALEEARRRTATVLATVATGVVGLDTAARVLIANRQAVDLLGVPLEEGASFGEAVGTEWDLLTCAVREFLADPVHADAAAELTVGGRRLALHLAPLGPDVSGVVLALNDVTDISRAERVLAWGEMARQVAHEIKNPLTPVRLGIQHLQRAHRDGRADFDRTLDETSRRILTEIDRLDTIARAFSRFAAPTDETQPLERIDLAAVATEVVQLYRLAGEGADVVLEAPDHIWAAARRDELKEVLVNLLENARNADASTITLRIASGSLIVTDNGQGIPPELLPRIFEPRFSTTTSGSGLGLPIVRRLVESWGGSVAVDSVEGQGTTVTIRLTA